MLTIAAGQMSLTVEPSLGGSVRSLRYGSLDILRPTPDGCNDSVGTGAFSMMPFAGRVDQGKFQFQQRAVQLGFNAPPEPHALHGHLWQQPWTATHHTQQSLRLQSDYVPGDWPWRYRASQRFDLNPQGLLVTLELTNLAREPMPAGLGWHPFFPKRDAQLRASMAQYWPNRADKIPLGPKSHPVLQQLTRGYPVSALNLDNAFTRDPVATAPDIDILWPQQDVQLRMRTTGPMNFVVIYTAGEQDFFCVEPTSHVPNCLNNPLPSQQTGATTLQANETLRAQVDLRLRAPSC